MASSRIPLGMSTLQGAFDDEAIPVENMYDTNVTWFDIVNANEAGPISPMQDTSKMNNMATEDATFVHGNISITANPILSSYGDNPDVSLHIYLVICALFGIIIVTFNGLLLYCICHFPYLHTPTNTLVASVCIADFLGGCEQFFKITTMYYTGRSSWVKLCLAGEVIRMFSVGGKIWSIIGASIDSCLYICKPLNYQNWVTIERVIKIMTIIWTLNITFATTTLVKFNRLVIGMPCRVIVFLDPVVYIILYFSQFICLVAGFLLCYSVIAMVAWQQRKCTQQIAPAEAHTTNAAASDLTTGASDWNIVKMIALIPGVFFLSMSPAMVLGLVKNKLVRNALVHLKRAVIILWFTQYWANPIICAWKNEDFRRAIKTVLQIRSRRIHNHSEPDSA